MDRRHSRYLLREGHFFGCFLGTLLYAIWPPLAGAWLLVCLVLWAMSWKDANG